MNDQFDFTSARQDTLAMIPPTARRILEFGCGDEHFGASLKRRQSCEFWRVESDSGNAIRASEWCDQVITAEPESLELPESSFDAIVCRNTLRHIADPKRFLLQCRKWLTADGTLIASFPNAQHHSNVTGLINGNWPDDISGGIHGKKTRLFTRREIEKLCFATGFRIVDWRIQPGPGWNEWNQSGRPCSIRLNELVIKGLPPEYSGDFFADEFQVRLQVDPVPEYALTSVILVTHNQMQYTRRCIDSIIAYTGEPIELIVVDNGSTDGSIDYFLSRPEIRLITNSENRGFPAAVNQGIRIAGGSQILLINNDTIVTTGWLRRLLNTLNRDSQIGLVGPVSNAVSGMQRVPVEYRELAHLDGFAWERSKRYAGQVIDTDRLVGFCLLIRREVVDRIGEFDERFGLGNFEDDDYCRRARSAGYRAAIALDSFVHHFGGQTFRGAGIDYRELLKRNQAIYLDKWKPRIAEESISEGDVATAGMRPRLSLCMIVRDNEAIIDRCLSSIAPFVDEMIVVDTGSKDGTPTICADKGAKVFSFPWCDDFSAARNESLRHATGDWIFWMDSDDVITPEQGGRLRELVDGSHARRCDGYIVQVHCASDEPGQYTSVDHVKLFKNHRGFFFEHRIHEQILPSIRRAGGDVEFSSIYIDHEGSRQTPSVRLAKLERDFRILSLELAEHPDHPFVLFNLGMTCEDCGRYLEAESYLRRSLQVAGPHESHVRKAWALLTATLKAQGRTVEALAVADEAIHRFPTDHELLFRRAVIHQSLERHIEAVSDYRRILSQPQEQVFRSVDPAVSDVKTFYNLSISLECLGRKAEALEYQRRFLKARPESAQMQLAVASSLFEMGRIDELNELSHDLPAELRDTACGAQVSAMVLRVNGHIEDAVNILQAAWERWGSVRCLDTHARILVEAGQAARALPILRQLLEVRPDDPAVLHNVASALVASGQFTEAVPLLMRSLELRPGSKLTARLLEVAKQSISSPPSSCLDSIDK